MISPGLWVRKLARNWFESWSVSLQHDLNADQNWTFFFFFSPKTRFLPKDTHHETRLSSFNFMEEMKQDTYQMAWPAPCLHLPSPLMSL